MSLFGDRISRPDWFQIYYIAPTGLDLVIFHFSHHTDSDPEG